LPSTPFAIAVEPTVDAGPRFGPRTLAADDLQDALALSQPVESWPAHSLDEDPERWDGLA